MSGLGQAAWYVLRTKSKREEQVGQLLEQRDVEFFLPMLQRLKVTRVGRKAVPLFPSYLFVHLGVPSEEYVRVRSAPGVVGIVQFDGEPAPVPDGVVHSIRNRLEVENRVRYPSPFRQGQRVIITEGPFKDIEAIFDGRLTGAGRVRVLIDLLGKQWQVQVKVTSLSRAG